MQSAVIAICLVTLGACKPREDVVGCMIHNGSTQFCLEQGPPLPKDARLYALDECRSVNGTLIDECPVARRLGRCDGPLLKTQPERNVAARRTYCYADPGGLNPMTAQRARLECRAGTWVEAQPDAATP